MNDSIIWTCIVFPINIFFEHSCFLAEQFLRKIFSTNASVFKIIHVLWPCYPLIIIFTLVCWVLVYHYLNTTFSFCECIVSALSECPHYANRLMCLRYRYGWQISEEYMFIIYFNACTSGKYGLLRVHFFHHQHSTHVTYGLLFIFCLSSIPVFIFLFMYYMISSFSFCAVIRVEWRECCLKTWTIILQIYFYKFMKLCIYISLLKINKICGYKNVYWRIQWKLCYHVLDFYQTLYFIQITNHCIQIRTFSVLSWGVRIISIGVI